VRDRRYDLHGQHYPALLIQLDVRSGDRPQLVEDRVEAIDANMAPAPNSIKRLSIDSPNITDVSIGHVAKLKNLEWLGIWSWKISDESLKQFVELPKLTGLEIFGTSITNEGLSHIGKLNQLETLRLDGQLINDDGLLHLYKLKS
jgi:hypothetical protein